MLLNELFEISANPRYLSAAERSLSQARDTQRQYWRSPEEKAAARRTELKREKGIAGYSKRHRAANPEMYPQAKSQPAPKLRDPSTEYSDDYSVWAKGRRDTLEQGVAEGTEDKVAKHNAAVKKMTKRSFAKLDYNHPDLLQKAPKGYRFTIDHLLVPNLNEQGVAEGSLNEFAPGNSGGESGQWYTDDQMTDIVGEGWWQDMDVSGNKTKEFMLQQAQNWLDDQGYSVQVLNCKINDDNMDWYIEGSFYNPRFAKKGVAEGHTK